MEANARGTVFGARANGFYSLDHRVRGQSSPSTHQIESHVKLEEGALRGYLHIDTHPNGGASVVHMYQDEIDHLPGDTLDELTQAFFKEVFLEEPSGVAKHVMGVVHGAGSHLPELVTHLGLYHPDLTVKIGHLKKSEIETVTMEDYMQRVKDSYSHGTFRCGPLLQLSLVGQVSEESGGYFPGILGGLLYSMYAQWSLC